IGQRFQDQPLVEAAIQEAIGKGYHNLFELDLMVPHLERAFALRKAHLGQDHPDTLGSMGSLAEAYKWVGRHSESIALRQELLENRISRFDSDHAETMACVSALAEAYQFAGQLESSARLWKQLLEKQRSISGTTHPSTLGLMVRLAWTYG